MKISKTAYIIIFVVIALIILAILFWDKLFPPSETCPNGKPIPADGNCASVMTAQEINNYNNTVTAPKPLPPNATKSQVLANCIKPITYIQSEEFPLKLGQMGMNIKTLQAKIGAPVDGEFGCITQSKLWDKYGYLSVTEDFFNNTINV